MSLWQQFRMVFRDLWRILKPNPLRAYVLIFGRFFESREEQRARIQRYLDEAEANA